MTQPRVVIVGGGFGGLTAARSLRRAAVRVTLLDRSNHHLFQPLLYQVASAGLSPANIASPIRAILARQTNVEVALATVTGIDLAAHSVVLDDGAVPYDYAIVAAGARTQYFGHPEWEPFAPGIKSLDDAIEIRRRALTAFERAERTTEVAERRRLLTFVVIGGGPTGTELAGAFAELSRFALTNDFRSIVPQEARVILLEGGPRILAAFDPRSSERAARQLESLGVIVRTGASVKSVDAHGVEVNGERIDAATVVWAAGVETSPLARSLGAPLDSQGRVVVGRDLSLPGYPDVFVIGDMCSFEQDGARLPGLSPVAIQQGRFAARAIRASLDGGPRGEFRYNDRGKMATVGRSRAVAETHGMRLTGFVAWMVWLLVHLWFLIGFRSRLIVMFEWFWSYATYGRGARLITGRAAAQPDPPSSFQSPP